jgi:hypothetical protein
MATEKTALNYVNEFFDGFYDTAVKAPISFGDFLARISGYRDYKGDRLLFDMITDNFTKQEV